MFEEDFDAVPDPANWNIYGSPTHAYVSDGALHLVGSVDPALSMDVGGGVGSSLQQSYGRWEVRFRVGQGNGYSADMLLWPRNDADWPAAGEIDVMDVNEGDRASGLNYLQNLTATQTTSHTVDADFTQWHTVAVDWLPDHVTYYLDGAPTFTVTPGTFSAGIPSASPMHLALQLDQGCDDFIPCRDPSTPDQVVMDVDWVKVFHA